MTQSQDETHGCGETQDLDDVQEDDGSEQGSDDTHERGDGEGDDGEPDDEGR